MNDRQSVAANISFCRSPVFRMEQGLPNWGSFVNLDFVVRRKKESHALKAVAILRS